LGPGVNASTYFKKKTFLSGAQKSAKPKRLPNVFLLSRHVTKNLSKFLQLLAPIFFRAGEQGDQQGDQIGRIFTEWAIAYILWAV
jgi:hypothetical protein